MENTTCSEISRFDTAHPLLTEPIVGIAADDPLFAEYRTVPAACHITATFP